MSEVSFSCFQEQLLWDCRSSELWYLVMPQTHIQITWWELCGDGTCSSSMVVPVLTWSRSLGFVVIFVLYFYKISSFFFRNFACCPWRWWWTPTKLLVFYLPDGKEETTLPLQSLSLSFVIAQLLADEGCLVLPSWLHSLLVRCRLWAENSFWNKQQGGAATGLWHLYVISFAQVLRIEYSVSEGENWSLEDW